MTCCEIKEIIEFVLVASQAVSPYQVTKLAPQSQPVKANDRDAVHQVPHGISQEAVKRHKKSRGI